MTPLALGVIADDLTGGSAIAGEIARDRGITVDVVTLPAFDAARTLAVVVETGSRYIPKSASISRVVDAQERLKNRGCTTVMKKIDSTLKGNVATELATFVRGADGPVVIAPACPAVKLGLVGGIQLRDGVAGKDVSEMLEEVLEDAPTRLDLDIVRQGAPAVAAVIRQLKASNVILADALTDEDLAVISEGAISAGVRAFAGTYGLGAALAESLELGGAAASPPDPAADPRADRVLIVAGSANPVSAEQIRRLVADGAHEIVVDVPALLLEPVAENARVLAALTGSESSVIVVHSGANVTREHVTKIRDVNGWTERELAEWIATPFVNAIRALPDVGIYFLGGETTGAICDRLGWKHFTVLNEIAAAVPLARVEGSSTPFVLTKPGAFGEPDDLVIAAHRQQRLAL